EWHSRELGLPIRTDRFGRRLRWTSLADDGSLIVSVPIPKSNGVIRRSNLNRNIPVTRDFVDLNRRFEFVPSIDFEKELSRRRETRVVEIPVTEQPVRITSDQKHIAVSCRQRSQIFKLQ